MHAQMCTVVNSYTIHIYKKGKEKNSPLSIPWLKEMAILYAVGSANDIWEWHLVCCLASQDLVTSSSHETTVLVVTKGILKCFRKAARKSRLRRGPHVGKLCYWKPQIMRPAPVTYFTVSHGGLEEGYSESRKCSWQLFELLSWLV